VSRTLLIVTLLTAASGLTLALSWSGPKVAYARPLSEFLAQPARGVRVRLQGTLLNRSLCRATEPCELRLRLTGDSSGAEPSLLVRYTSCELPEFLAHVPESELVLSVEGELCAACHVFEASRVLALCPGKYQKGQYRSSKVALPLCAP
jgi:cytochrome c-type biogenesis protein CcmE